MFSERDRDACARAGIDVERSYREFQLDVRVGGPAMLRLLSVMAGNEGPIYSQGGSGARVTDELTPIELMVLQETAGGKEYAEMAKDRGVTLETIKTNMKRMRVKLGAHNRAHAVHIAHQRGIL